MNYKKYGFIVAFIAAGISISCSVDESKFPLPYNDKTVGAYARLYKVSSNILDGTNQASSAFEAIFEPVDEANGDNTESIEFYVSHRRGGLSDEVFVKSVSVAGFTAVPAPTISVYKRGVIRVTLPEMLTALEALVPVGDPDGAGPIAGASPVSGLQAYPIPLAGSANVGDQFVLRWVQVLKDGRRFTVLNPQTAVNRAFGNPTEENGTPNITTGQFYSSPFVFTMTVRAGLPATSWVGDYNLQQRTNWSPSHSTALHATHYPENMNQLNFPNQVVTLALVPGGLPSQRQFTCTYRGATVTAVINLEPSSPGANDAAVANLVSQYGMAGAVGGTSTNLGSVIIPVMGTGVQCTSERLYYWTTPATGTFAGSPAVNARFAPTALPGLPAFDVPNRGAYRTDITGVLPGQVMTINIDDDADEYGRRYGYCSFFRRVLVTLTKI